ncbi:GDP-fucose protein O-fucosyltransferase family protein [Skeletonema marinoi]|uniref:GDP-fucose protein O-fucosyltransferase family protein n=1 Tax=Skeletonema marinoi TaxID=267567 RepID=A0AAD8YLJ0_9STRA|nr:GDP-fucose protein O-fucosyltransferase family protein [Skeletonema marinoi]
MPARRLRNAQQPPPLLLRFLTLLLQVIACLLLTTTIYLFHLHHHSIHTATDTVAHNSPGGSALRHKLDLAHYILQKSNNQNEKAKEEVAREHGWKGNAAENFVRPAAAVADDIEVVDKSYHENKKSWSKLQQTLLQNNMLPTPIPRTHTSRGFSGLPPDQTPALEGALRGTIHCPNTDPQINELLSSMLASWNEPRGTRDDLAQYYYTDKDGTRQQHPFVPLPLDHFDPQHPEEVRTKRRRYLTFEPDTGGWNNLRISFENILTLAALSGRTLVLPPEQSMYLLYAKKGDTRNGYRQYTDYFNMTDNSDFLRRVPIISAEEFLRLEGGDDGFVPLNGYDETKKQHLLDVAKGCEERKKSEVFCEDLYDHYLAHGQLQPLISEPVAEQNCFVFDKDVFLYGDEYISKLSEDVQARIQTYCKNRPPVYYNKTMHDAPVWHFETMDLKWRLLTHSYALLFFTDPVIGNYYLRFARDYFRYHDEVYCAAGKMILAMQYEKDVLFGDAHNPGADLDRELVGGYSSLHVRRGDLQFPEVRFDSATWYENTKELWKPNEILYIATDERNATFFDDFRRKHSGPLRFFDDFRELADLDSIDSTLYGMIETVVSSRGSVFAGTWFSTFSGYIVRLRGYYGMSKYFTYYSWLDRKFFMHEWMNVGSGSLFAREYPVAWTGIDGDKFVDNDSEKPRKKAREVVSVDGGTFLERDTLYPRDEMEEAKAVAESELNKLGRGLAGRPMSETPAVLGAFRGHVSCDVNVDNSVVYWNEPQGHRDYAFKTPFGVGTDKPKYLAFTPDGGGFNNIRMSFEIILIIAAALDRILVLPPEQPMYLLRNDAAKRHRGLDAFFDIESPSFQKRVRVITMEQFVMKEGLVDIEGQPQGQFPADVEEFDHLATAAKECNKGMPKKKWKEGDLTSCDIVHAYLSKHGTTPEISASHHQCLVFDKGMFDTGKPDDEEGASEFCSSGKRKMVFLTKEFDEPQLLYIQAGKPPTRMLSHYYGYMYFSDVAVGNYYKRLVRDLLHYRPEINCAAGKIIKALQDEGKARGFLTDINGAGGYSAMHIRRGDFQYKNMKISGEEWVKNTNDVFEKNEILYIATDEKDKTFFEPFRRAGYTLRFLDDFKQLAGLQDLDPNHMGMLETVVASRGRKFSGTFRSTFSGYINRLRGYHGMSVTTSFYGSMGDRFKHHIWPAANIHSTNLDTYAKEWPDAWNGIDADVAPSKIEGTF